MSMQPPPRRAKLLAAVRATQNQQLCQLQTKHHYDTELLDDLRSFTNKRAQIERDYSHALLKLSSTYLQKKVPNIPEAKLTNRSTIYSVWRTTLDETEKLAKAHLASAEVFQQQISDSAKSVKNAKMHAAKKCFETMRKMQEGIHQDYVEMEKIKKLYFEEEHLAHCARDKAYVAEEKLKRKKGKIFQSLTSLQKNSSKFSYKREACDTRATSTRNQYLMWIAALNAHLARYHELELPELMKTIDGQYYEKVAEYLTTLSRTELLTCSATQNSYSNVLQQAAKISRYEDLQTFLSKHPTVGNKQEYKFEPCDEDKVTSISAEYNAGHFLTSDAKKWSLCYLKECRVLKQQNDILKDLYKGDGTQASQSSMSDSNGQPRSIDVEVKIDDVSDIIRRAEISKLKAWARLEVLRNSGIPVDEYLQFSDTDSIESFEHSTDDKAKSSSSQSDKVRLESVSEAENKSELDESYESDFQDTSSEMSVPKEEPAAVDVAPNSEHKSEEADTKSQRDSLRSDRPESIIFPSCRCIALFQYEASNSDELTIAEQEVLDIVGEGDGDGWVRARNSNGIEGYIPQNYVEVENGLEVPRSIHPAPVSFSSVDYSVEEEDRLTNGFLPLTLEQQTADTGVQFCRALYDYEATCEEELTFFEGQIIKVLKTTVNDVDDGWWEGEINDQVGLFPSLVVEMLKNSGEPHTPVDLEFTTPGIAPPAYTPPKPSLLLPPSQVIITQPTPQTENSSEDAVTFSVKKDDFEMELTNDQQAQYRSQFSSSESDGSMDVSATVTEKQPVTAYHELVSSPESPPQATDEPEKESGSISEKDTEDGIRIEDTIFQLDEAENVEEMPVHAELEKDGDKEQIEEEATNESHLNNKFEESLGGEKWHDGGNSGVIITVDTVDTPPRSDDEQEDVAAAAAAAPDDIEAAEEYRDDINSNNNNTGNNNGDGGGAMEHDEPELMNDEDALKDDDDDDDDDEKASIAEQGKQDSVEQISPSSDSTKTADSVVEVVVVADLKTEDEQTVEAMDEEEDDDEMSLR